jgi:RHS repeat-associated protein
LENRHIQVRPPWQYLDQESGTSYNYFRDYDPATGRYLESDPIGLKGGLNTYSYVWSKPLQKIDPKGLFGAPWEPSPGYIPFPECPTGLKSPYGCRQKLKLTCKQTCNFWVGLICGPIATATGEATFGVGWWFAWVGCRVAVGGGCSAAFDLCEGTS